MIEPPPPSDDRLPSLDAPLDVGGVTLRNRVVLAPMSGVSDGPFRAIADSYGAGMVVSEMIASEQLAIAEANAVQRTQRVGTGPFVIQLAGREARWMAEGARIAEASGADIVDINMGCPARKVTGGRSGSALMRDLDHALTLIDAAVGAVRVPVALKMRLGWDDETLNAAELARRAEQSGVQLLTVHGRTRCQFFKGQADWQKISAVTSAVSIPVIANGDVCSRHQIEEALRLSKADAVMIGRGAYGAPWAPGLAARGVSDICMPPLGVADIVEAHFEAILEYYGPFLGIRNARKHLGWYVSRVHGDGERGKTWRQQLCQAECPKTIRQTIRSCFTDPERMAA